MTTLCVVGLCLVLCGWVTPKEFVADISQDPYVFEAHSLPTISDHSDDMNTRITPTIGNGHISTRLWNDAVFMNGFYNGFSGNSHRAHVEAQHAMWLTVDGVTENNTERRHSLDTRKGVFTTTILTQKALVTYMTYAHQYYNRLLVTDVTVKRALEASGDDVIAVNITSRVGDVSKDLEVLNNGTYNSFRYVSVRTLITESNNSDVISAYVAYTPLDKFTSLVLDAGENETRKVFIMGLDMAEEKNLKSDLDNAERILDQRAGEDVLLKIHTDGWRDIWKRGRIELEGNLDAQKAITASMYYLYSSLPSMNTSTPNNVFSGTSPGSLANGGAKVDYLGHVFWDMETWMYPSILMFRPDLAKEMLNYRIHSMNPAFKRANDGGYNGTRFPWESAYTGSEVTQFGYTEVRENQQHITSDITFAAHQYMSATRDQTWLTQGQGKDGYTGYKFIHEMARFWASRPTYDSERNKWEINGVMPPDEYQSCINNSVYTNAGAAFSVNYARYASCLAGKDENEEVPESWIEKMRKLEFPFNKNHRYHEEFEGYQHYIDTSTYTFNVKQADVILLGYPLLMSMPDDVRRNDLTHYESETNPNGPAMTWSMFCINWLELGDKSEADRMFRKSYHPFVRQPFKIWTEAQNGFGATNFLTGMGGFLQTLVFGYGGLRLRFEELDFLPPQLPPQTTKMTLYDLQYLNATFDLKVDGKGTNITVKTVDPSTQLLIHRQNETAEEFLAGQTYVMKSDRFRIYSRNKTNCSIPRSIIDVDYVNKGTIAATNGPFAIIFAAVVALSMF